MPSLIVFFIFLGILLLWNFLGNVDKIKSNPDINTSSVKQRSRYILKNTFLFGTSYIMIFLLSYFLKDEKDLGDKANIIVKLANAYLNIELLAVLIMFFAFMYIFLVNKNKKAYFEFLKKPIVVMVYLSAFSYAVTHKIELGYKYNVVGYMFLAVFSILILFVDIKDKIIEDEQSEESNPYEPIKNYEGLCESHKDKADTLKYIIERNSNCGGISILVKGDWGIGKTSVVNGAIDILKNHKKIEKNLDDKEVDDLINYEILRINALEIDSLDSLFNYFFDFIRRCLKERGAYTGIASEYREFVSSALGIVTNESFGNVFTRLFYSENKNYREKKEELEKSIKDVLGKDKIIIVVDDIERCEKEKVKQFIFFIKEIATMNNCVTIFVSDEKVLKECILNDNDNDNNRDMNDFLDKFFNYTVSVNTTNYTEVLDSLSKTDITENYMHCYSTISKNLCYMRFKKINNNLKSDELGFLTLEEVINKIIRNLDNKLNKYEANIKAIKSDTVNQPYKNQVEDIKKARPIFISDIKNPRKLIKIYKSYEKYRDIVKKKLNLRDNDRSLYFEQINISETIFILSYIEVSLPEQFYNIEKNKIDNYLETLNKEKMRGKSEIILDIADRYWFEKSIYSEFSVDFKSNYLYKKTITFLKELMYDKEIRGNIFTSQEDEWVSILSKLIDEKQDISKCKEIEQNWLKVLEVLILKCSYDINDISKKEKYKITFLLDEVYKKLEKKDDILKIFDDNDLRNIIFQNTGILKLIKDSICKEDIKTSFFEDIFDRNKQDYIHTVFFNKLCLIFRLIFYVDIVDIDNKKLLIEYLYELSFKLGQISSVTGRLNEDINNKYNSEISAQDKRKGSEKLEKKKLIILMKIVLEDICGKMNLHEYSYTYNESDDINTIDRKLEEFLNYVESFMEKKEWNEDTVFQRELEIARLSRDDMKAFFKIIEVYSTENTDFSNISDFIEMMTSGDSNNIKENIENNIESNMDNFRSFFEDINNTKISFSNEAKEKLDLIVDVYEKRSKNIDCNKYRRILLEHIEREY